MTCRHTNLVATLGLCLVASATFAQDTRRQPRMTTPAVQNPIGTPSEDMLAEFGPHADLHNYRASVFDNGTACSATLLGPRVLLTAAHCSTLNADHIYFSINGRDYSAYCDPFDGRDPWKLAGDWALCSVEQAEGVLDVPHYERLNRDATLLRRETRLLITGFGITGLSGTGGHFNVGIAQISTAPSGESDVILTQGATTTPGDSGSAMFLVTNGTRRIVGVNAARLDKGTRESAAASISTPRAITFITTWLAAHPGHAVCGYTDSALKCQP